VRILDMTDPPSGSALSESGSLCAACAHARVVTSAKGASFVLCGLSRTDRRFAKYPRLPVLACVGFEELGEGGGAQGHQR
jgi:hypothetical protein